jgi:hypothetical protein
MVSASTCTHPVSGRAAQLSTRIVFFIAGFGMAAWAPLVPFAKARAGIGEGVLGLLLLCLAAGAGAGAGALLVLVQLDELAGLLGLLLLKPNSLASAFASTCLFSHFWAVDPRAGLAA